MINNANQQTTALFKAPKDLTVADRVLALQVLPDSRLVSAQGKIIRLWNADTGLCLKLWQACPNLIPDSITSLEILKNGLLAVGTSRGHIKVWNSDTGKCVNSWNASRNGSMAHIRSLVELPSGGLVSASESGSIRVWNSQTGQCIKVLREHKEAVYALQVLPDGTLASGSTDSTIKLWNVNSGQCIKTLIGHAAEVSALQVLRNGTLLASASGDKSIKIWDVNSGQCVKTLNGHEQLVRALQVLSDNMLASSSFDRTIKIWDVNSGQCVETLTGHTNYVNALQVMPDGTLVSGSGDKSIKLWHRDPQATFAADDSQRLTERRDIMPVNIELSSPNLPNIDRTNFFSPTSTTPRSNTQTNSAFGQWLMEVQQQGYFVLNAQAQKLEIIFYWHKTGTINEQDEILDNLEIYLQQDAMIKERVEKYEVATNSVILMVTTARGIRVLESYLQKLGINQVIAVQNTITP